MEFEDSWCEFVLFGRGTATKCLMASPVRVDGEPQRASTGGTATKAQRHEGAQRVLSPYERAVLLRVPFVRLSAFVP